MRLFVAALWLAGLAVPGLSLAQPECPELRLSSPNGPGVIQRRDCSRIEGTFRDGRLQGPGKITYPNSVEEGNFSRGRLWGPGKITWREGRTSEGDFVDGRLSGPGRVVFDAAGEQWHEGMFFNGSPSGPGRRRDARGEISEGMFDSSGNLQGRGIRTFADGSKLYSQFRDGVPVGEGVLVKADGTEEPRVHTMSGRLQAPAAVASPAAPPAAAPSAGPPAAPPAAPPSAQPPPALPLPSGVPSGTQAIQEVDRAIRGLRGLSGR
jgi:hypothetical protein